MVQTVEIHRAYKYRLHQCDKLDSFLHQRINVAGLIWNHALALQRRYYRRFKKYVNVGHMKKHIAYLRMKTRRYAFWRALGSQAVQDVLERQDTAYQRFFKRLNKRPTFKKVKHYKSFTLKQAGWQLVRWNENTLKPNGKYSRARGVIQIGGQCFKFVQHRPLAGCIKTVCVKRDGTGRLWLCFSVLEKIVVPEQVSVSNIGGFDFGLKVFLMDNSGHAWMRPLFFGPNLKRIKVLNRAISRKVEGSHNQRSAQWLLSRAHGRIADKRRDFHFKLAQALCDEYDMLVFEDLNLEGMKRLWGRKVSDLAFGQFMHVLEHVALKRGKTVVRLDRFERTTGKCSACRHEQNLELRERTFRCEECRLVLDRDFNAAINIFYAGASAYAGRGVVRPAQAGSPALKPEALVF